MKIWVFINSSSRLCQSLIIRSGIVRSGTFTRTVDLKILHMNVFGRSMNTYPAGDRYGFSQVTGQGSAAVTVCNSEHIFRKGYDGRSEYGAVCIP